jgi:two-component system, chemotaxis family, protein-glutamate methylesterase/glutaminase
MVDEDPLPFACPHCGGPLHVTEDGDLECKHKHRFTVDEVMQEQTRTSSKATWLAVKALQERAETSRWAARDPELYGLGDAAKLEESATEDEENAAVLQKQAQMLDLTLWRISKATEGDGTPL